MEKARLKKTLAIIGKTYFVLVTLYIVLVFAASYAWYFQDDAIYDFCIHVLPSQPNHFVVNEDNACLIDWWPFLQEAVVWPLIFYLVLLSPILLYRLFTKIRQRKSHGAE